MANELNIQLDPFANTGLTLLGKIFNKAGTQQGSTVSLTENAPALYSGDFDLSSISDGAYAVRFETNTPDKLYGTGTLFVRNNTEVSQENFFNPSLDEVTTDTESRDASKADVSGLSTFDPSSDTVTTDTASRDASKADVSGLSTFDPSTDTVTTDAASRDANIVKVNNVPVTGDGTDNNPWNPEY